MKSVLSKMRMRCLGRTHMNKQMHTPTHMPAHTRPRMYCPVSKNHSHTLFWEEDDRNDSDSDGDDYLYVQEEKDFVLDSSPKPVAHSIITALNALVTSPRLTGTDLRQMLLEKWGKSCVVNIKRLDRYYALEISGFHLEDGSARMSEDAYILRTECICEYIQSWSLVPYVCEQIRLTPKKPSHIAGLIDSPILIPLKLIPRHSS